jgi:hypothetical protein
VQVGCDTELRASDKINTQIKIKKKEKKTKEVRGMENKSSLQ